MHQELRSNNLCTWKNGSKVSAYDILSGIEKNLQKKGATLKYMFKFKSDKKRRRYITKLVYVQSYVPAKEIFLILRFSTKSII